MITPSLIVNILLILALAWILGLFFSRFGLPLMLGELLAGLILGPPLLGWVTATPSLELMADFGIFFVMLHTGIEMDPRETLEHFWPSLAAALGGFVLPFALGFLVTRFFGGSIFQSLFVGIGMSITAVAVQSVVLKSMRINRSQPGHIIIGAAIIEEIMSLIGLSILLGVARSGSIEVGEIVLLLVKTTTFFGITIIFGEFIMPRLTRRLTDEAGKGFTFAMTVSLALAYMAELAGLHLIIGAFLAGQFVRREIMDERIYEAIADRFYGISYGLLMPIFFASLSFHLRFNWSWPFVIFTLMLTIAAVVGKVLGAGLSARAYGLNKRESLVVGIGMNGRGAVELVVASVVLTASQELMDTGVLTVPLLTEEQFSALILMAFLTTVLSPLALKWAVRRTCLPAEWTKFCSLVDDAPRPK